MVLEILMVLVSLCNIPIILRSNCNPFDRSAGDATYPGPWLKHNSAYLIWRPTVVFVLLQSTLLQHSFALLIAQHTFRVLLAKNPVRYMSIIYIFVFISILLYKYNYVLFTMYFYACMYIYKYLSITALLPRKQKTKKCRLQLLM